MSESQYIIVTRLGSFDPTKGPICLRVINNGLMEVRHGGVTQFTMANHTSDTEIVAEVEKFNAVCEELAAKKAAKEKDPEDEELVALRKRLEHYDASIVDLSMYFLTIDDEAPEKHGFVRHMYRKQVACKLAIVIKELQRHILRAPIREVSEFKVWSKTRKLNALIEESKGYGDVLDKTFEAECTTLINTATRLEVAIKLLKEA